MSGSSSLPSSFVIDLLAPEEDNFCRKLSCIIVSLCFVALVSTFPISVLRWHGIPSAIFFLSALQNRADHEFRPARLVYKQPSTKHLWTPRKPLSRAWLDQNKRQVTASDRGAGTRPTPKSFPVVGIVQSM